MCYRQTLGQMRNRKRSTGLSYKYNLTTRPVVSYFGLQNKCT